MPRFAAVLVALCSAGLLAVLVSASWAESSTGEDSTENASTENASTENASTENASTDAPPTDRGRDARDTTEWPTAEQPAAFLDDTAPGFRSLGPDDFTPVNCPAETFTWQDGTLHCTGTPLGVLRTVRTYRNFELVVEWMHERPGGNSGVFVWVTPESIVDLTLAGQPGLPKGVEVQILDHAFTDQRAAEGRDTSWFGTNGDVFPVGVKLQVFEPTSPNGSRSFPRKHLALGHGRWNHYYVRAINGEVRLWVNGEEVSGGTGADPDFGYLCLESEGSPIQFRKLRLRELP